MAQAVEKRKTQCSDKSHVVQLQPIRDYYGHNSADVSKQDVSGTLKVR